MSTGKLARRFIELLLPLFLFACGNDEEQQPADGGPPKDSGTGDVVPTTNAEHNLMLEQLGFSVAAGPRLDPAGDAVEERWHPLRTRYAAFYPKMEIYIAGGPVLAGEPALLLDDAVAEYEPLEVDGHPDKTWVQAQYKNALALDVDDDGLDEIFIVYFASGSGVLKSILLDPNDRATAVEGVIDYGANATSLDPWAQPSMAAGDIDGDGKPELAIGFGKLYLLKGLGTNKLEVEMKSYVDQNDVNVAIGNIDRDPEDELVVTHTETVGSIKGFYEIIAGGNIQSPLESGELRITDKNNNDHSFAETKVAIGDVDGDRIGDIVFHGRRVRPGGNHWHLFLMRYEPSPGPATAPHFGFRPFLQYTNAVAASTPRTLALLDANEDGLEEIYGWGSIVRVNSSGEPEVLYQGMPGWPRAVAGNIDSDRRDDLLLATNGQLRIYGLDGLDKWVLKKAITGPGVSVDSPALALPNVDLDSALVRYDGDYELLFTDPHIVTVIASPPYQEGVGQDIDSTTATFGKTQASGVVKSQSLGFSVGFSVGFEYESDLFQTGVSAKTTFEAAFDWTSSESKSIETYHSYTTAPGKDKVVFTTVPFDVYYYTIVSSPRDDEVGKVVTVNLPRSPQMLGTSLEFYNARNGGGRDVDDSILAHTLGDVASYPDVDDKERILNEAEQGTPSYQQLWNGPIQVDESGSNTLGISTTQGSARGASMDFTTTFEWETKSGGATAGGSVGFHYGHSYELSTEEGAIFEGTVGAIPGSEYTEHAYCYGLFVYPQLQGGQRFLVMNWWTQRQCAAP